MRPAGRTHLAALLGLALAAGCGTAHPPGETTLEAATATLEDYRRAHPAHPALAEYKFRLQKRLDRLFFEAFRELDFAKVHLPGEGHGFTLKLTVYSDGRTGADTDEIRRVAADEPTLATAVFTALAGANRAPEPFPPAVVAEVGPYFVYLAQFRVK